MSKTALMLLVMLALSAITISGQGQTDQSTASSTTPLPPNDVWYVYDSWIEQYADSLKESYGFDNCEFYKKGEYILFVLSNDGESSVNLALFDISQESFINHRGIASDLYYGFYLNKNKEDIYNSIKPKISSIEANSQVIKDFTNEGVRVYDKVYLPNPTKFGYYASNIAAWAKAYVSCKEVFEPENIGLGCAASINSLALESKLSDAKGLGTYDQILKAIEERKSEWPEFLDEAEKAVHDSMTSEEAQLKITQLIKYSWAYVEFDPVSGSLTPVGGLSGWLSDASREKITKITGKLILGMMIEPGDYKMATQFGTLANWHAMTADEYAERAKDDLELFSINPSIENYHQVVRDCINGYENVAVGYLLLSVIIQSQADTKTGWAGAAISDGLNTIKDVVHYLGLDSFVGVNLGPSPKVADLIKTYQALATKNLEWKEETLNMDGIFTRDVLKEISEDLIVPKTPISTEVPTNEDLHPPILSDAKFHPDSGSECDQFTFSIVYKDEDGDEAQDAYVIISGFDAPKKIYRYSDQEDINLGKMVKGDGDPSSGILYTYTNTLKAAPECYYRFYFSNKKGSKVYLPKDSSNSPGLNGPSVGIECPETITTVDAHPFKITIFNSAGYRASGAKVILDGTSNNTTDLQGELVLSLKDGNHTIDASKLGYGIGNWSGYLNHTLTPSINITLRPAPKNRFTITTVNPVGFSVEGTEVVIDGVLKGSTDHSGNLNIELTDGSHTIEANKSGYGKGNWSGELDHSKMMGVEVRLNGSLEYPFKITVINAAGYTIEGAIVSIDGIMKGITDQKGEKRVMLVEGIHVIEANKTDYGSGNWTGILNYSLAKEVAVWINKGTREYPFNVTVVNAANYTIEGAVVSVAGVKRGITDRSGNLRVMLAEGNQTIRADKTGYGSNDWTGYLNHTIAKDVVVRINGTIEYPFNITVMNPARYVMQGADVSVDGKPIGYTDANGVLEAMITEGNHTVEANKTGYLPGNWTGRLNHTQMNGFVIELGGSSLLIDMKPVDLCLVLDTSGSMADPECQDLSKIQAVKEAAEDTIAGFFFPGTSNRIAIVSFSDVSNSVEGFTNNYSEAYSKVSLLSAGGSTSFGLGLSQSIDEFKKLNGTNHVKAIIFMSDGMNNTPPDYGYYLNICRWMGIRVYTIGYGSEADHDLLREMARLSGGDYLFADPCGDPDRIIRNTFIKLQMKASGSNPTINASGFVAQGQTVNATSFNGLLGSKYITIVGVYSGSHLKVILVGPDGKVVDPKDYVYTEGPRIISIRLKEPKPGTYTVQVYGDQVNGTEPYTIYVAPKYVAIPDPNISFKTVAIKETSGVTLRDYPVKIPFSSRDFPLNAKADGSDLNIIDQNGDERKHWVESWDAKGKKAVVWVKVPEIPAKGEVNLAVLTGNPGEPAENNGSDIFDFFDDFSDASIDQYKWTSFASSNASVSQDNGILRIHADPKSVSSADLISKETFSSPVTIRFKANISAGQNNDRKSLGLSNTDVGTVLNQPGSFVCWKAIDSALNSYHSFPIMGPDKRASYPVMLNYLAQNRTWEIIWQASKIEFDPNGAGKPHEIDAQTSEPIPWRFSINTSICTKSSDIYLDWVSAWRCASQEPKVSII
jgi:uncharacterized protein involved in high-affinity Fe2+ transport